MGGSPDAPDPVDPYEAAEAQTGTNVGTAIANRLLGQVNKVSPTGSLTFDKAGSDSWTDPVSGQTYEIPRYTQTEKLSAAEQGLYDQKTRASTNLSRFAADQSQRLGGLLSKPIDLNDIPNAPGQLRLDRVNAPTGPTASVNLNQAGNLDRVNLTGAGNLDRVNLSQMGNNFNSDVTRTYGANDFSDDRRRVERAMMKRMEPDMTRDRQRLDDSLANRGITLGSREYDRAMDMQNRSVNDARLGTILAGGQEQSRMTGLERDQAAFENAATGQRYNQALGQRAFNNQSDLSEAQFNNQAQLDRRGFNNQAQLGEAGFNNASQLSRRGFNNQAMVQEAGFNDAAQNQRFGQQMQATGMGNTASIAENASAQNNRSNAFQEDFSLRNQPINEIAALLGTGQVSMPQFANSPMPQMPTTDIAGLMSNSFNQQMAGHNSQMQANNAKMGGLFGIGNALLGGIL